MQKFIVALAACGLVASGPAHAAEDMGLTLHNQGGTSLRSGVGAQASMTIKLGSRRTVRASEKVTLGIAAGPMMRVSVGKGSITPRQTVTPLASFNLRPGHSARFDLAGQSVARHYTVLGAAEERRDEEKTPPEKPKKAQSTGDKVGWVALVAGGVMVALVAAFAISCPTCDS